MAARVGSVCTRCMQWAALMTSQTCKSRHVSISCATISTGRYLANDVLCFVKLAGGDAG